MATLNQAKSTSQIRISRDRHVGVRVPRGERKCVSDIGRHSQVADWVSDREKTLLARTGPLVVVDFFCGGGGFTCGALAAEAVVASGIDSDSRAQDTYVRNNDNPDGEPVPFVLSRVEDLKAETLLEHLTPYSSQPVLFVGCPPCQPFTNLRTNKERSETDSKALTVFIDHVKVFRPDFVIVENVPGIRAKKYGPIWRNAVSRLRRAGYSVRYEVVNAARYGVPQKRLRTLLVACRTDLGKPPWPEETHQPGDYRTVRDAFRETKLASLMAGEASKKDALHGAAKLSDLNLRRIAAVSRSGGSRIEWPDDLVLECYRDHDGHTDVYGRMDWKKPAPTLTTRFVSLSNGRFGHPTQNRAITPREGALIQTFPADYMFYGESRDIKVIHIGNAVPPRLAEAFVRAVATRMNGSDRGTR